MIYQIKDWQKHFENNRSRSRAKCSFVCVPNKQHGMGFSYLMNEPDGAAIYGIWCCILGACSQQSNRNGWLTSDGEPTGRPWEAKDLAVKFRRPPQEIERALQVLGSESVGWIVIHESPSTRQESAAECPPTDRAVIAECPASNHAVPSDCPPSIHSVPEQCQTSDSAVTAECPASDRAVSSDYPPSDRGVPVQCPRIEEKGIEEKRKEENPLSLARARLSGLANSGQEVIACGTALKPPVSEIRAVEFPSEFPQSADEAVSLCVSQGIPGQFVKDTWNKAAGRGGRDAKDVPIRRWPNYVAAEWAYDRNRKEKERTNIQKWQKSPVKANHDNGF